VDYASSQLFQGDLLSDEELLWTGQPDTSSVLAAEDLVLIPFALFWTAFACFWEAAALGWIFVPEEAERPPLIFPLFGLPFVLIGLYLLFGRIIYRNWKKRHTYYAVTDKRVLVLTTVGSRNLQAAYTDSVPGVGKSVRRNGVGTISFGVPASVPAKVPSAVLAGARPVFQDVRDADMVYELVSRLRRSED